MRTLQGCIIAWKENDKKVHCGKPQILGKPYCEKHIAPELLTTKNLP